MHAIHFIIQNHFPRILNRSTLQGGTDQVKLQKELMEVQAEAKKSKAEADRLLQLMKNTQEQENVKDKLIKELQE